MTVQAAAAVTSEGALMDRTGRRRRTEAGQVLIIVAGSVGALLLLLGLVLDGGIAVFNRRDAQNIADIAARAGTHELADWHTGKKVSPNVPNVITSAMAANGCASTDSVPCTWQAWYVRDGSTGPVDQWSITAGGPTTATLGVRVAVNRQPGTFLARLAMIDRWNVDTQATAIAWEPRMAPAGNLLPIAFKLDPAGYDPGQVYDLTDGKDAPGGFGFHLMDRLERSERPGQQHLHPGQPGVLPAQGLRRRPRQEQRDRRPCVPVQLDLQPAGDPDPDLRHDHRHRQQYDLQHRRDRRLQGRVAGPAGRRQHPRQLHRDLPLHRPGAGRKRLAAAFCGQHLVLAVARPLDPSTSALRSGSRPTGRSGRR
jgi:hypothetical protein